MLCHPPERPHHPGCPRRDRPLPREPRRAGPALRRLHRDHPQVAQARPCRLPGPLRRPHKLPWKASEEERAIVCALRRATGFPLDDLTFVVTHFLPHLNRDAVYRILKAEGLSRLPPASRAAQAARHLQGVRGRLRAPGREAPAQAARPRWRDPQALPVSSPSTAARARSTWRSRTTRPSASAVAFLKEALRRLPLPGHARAHRPRLLLHGRRLRGGLPRAEVEHRKTRPYTPRTNGMVERFNGRVQREVLGITIAQPPRPGEPAAGLQPGLQRPPPARAGRPLARRGRARAARQPSPSWPTRPTEPPSDPCLLPKALLVVARRQGRLASRQLALNPAIRCGSH